VPKQPPNYDHTSSLSCAKLAPKPLCTATKSKGAIISWSCNLECKRLLACQPRRRGVIFEGGHSHYDVSQCPSAWLAGSARLECLCPERQRSLDRQNWATTRSCGFYVLGVDKGWRLRRSRSLRRKSGACRLIVPTPFLHRARS